MSIAFKMAQSKLKLKEPILEFYKLHYYTYNLSERTILEKFDKEGTIEIGMFENLKVRILITKENGLSSFIIV